MSLNGHITPASQAKDLGNASFKKGKWVEAIGHYTTSSVLNPSDPAPLLNRAQAYLKLEKWPDAIRDCTSVLSIPGNEKNIKALFRRATGRKETRDVDGAREDLEMILRLEPTNAAAQSELSTLPRSIPSATSSIPSKLSDPKSTPSYPSSSTNSTLIPIRIVDRFSNILIGSSSKPINDSENAIAGPSTSTTLPTTIPPSSQQLQPRNESFSSLKSTRSAKKQYAVQSTFTTNQEDHRNVRELQIPNSGLEWMLEWDRRDQSLKWELLRSTSSSHLFNLLSPILEPDLLGSLLNILHLVSSQGNNVDSEYTKRRIQTILLEMKKMQSFPMMSTMLSEEEKQWEREVEAWCGDERI